MRTMPTLNGGVTIKLIKQTRSRNNKISLPATEQICEKYKYLIVKLINDLHYATSSNYEDLMQAGYLGIIHACQTFKGSKSSFTTWCYINVRDRLQREKSGEFIIRIPRKKAHQHIITVDHSAELLEAQEEPVQEEFDADKIRKYLTNINHKFSEIECTIFREYYFNGVKLKDLSKQYNLNAKYVIKRITDTGNYN